MVSSLNRFAMASCGSTGLALSLMELDLVTHTKKDRYNSVNKKEVEN
jgi:hypothetical protein